MTAFDQYAIDAFQVNAVDYLLKPVDPERLDQAVQRARRRSGRVGAAATADGERALANAELERLVEDVMAPGQAGASGWPSRSASGSSSSRPAT